MEHSDTSSDWGKAAALYERLKSDLIHGRLTPGQVLSEASLSREYGVSRSPIREARLRLEHEGLVERDGMLVRVRRRSFEEIIDIYRVRVFLEGAIAADAAQRRQDMDLRRLDAAIRECDSVETGDVLAIVDANRRFHNRLVAAAHNLTLRDLQERLTAQIATVQHSTLQYPGRWDQARDEHRRIVQAVRERDEEGARTLAEQHMSRARDIRLELIDSDSDLLSPDPIAAPTESLNPDAHRPRDRDRRRSG